MQSKINVILSLESWNTIREYLVSFFDELCVKLRFFFSFDLVGAGQVTSDQRSREQ